MAIFPINARRKPALRPDTFVGQPADRAQREAFHALPVELRPAIRDRVVELATSTDLATSWDQAITEAVAA